MLYREAWNRLKKQRLVVACMATIVACILTSIVAVIPGVVDSPDIKREGFDKEGTALDYSYHPPTLALALGISDPTLPKVEDISEPVERAAFEARWTRYNEAFEGGVFTKAAWRHPFGLDRDGRGVLSMVLRGMGYAFTIGLVTTIVAIMIAVPIGATAGYFGGLVDELIVWFYTTLISIPQLLLLMAILSGLPNDIKQHKFWGLMAVLLVIGITTWVGLARLIRAEFMKHKQREYVQAARALGFGHRRIIFNHILPNVMHIVIITFTISFIVAINLEVFLSFIGVGIPPTFPTWGVMITGAKNELTRDPSVWWPLTSATVFLFVLSLSFSIFGDALRDALDPKLRK